MKILFVVPRSFNPKQMYLEYPMGVGILGTILEKIGHEIKIYDGNVESKEILDLLAYIEAFQPNVIGFSVITPNYPVAKIQIEKICSLFPDIRLIAGGVHASLFPEDLLTDGVDVVCLGEGEIKLPILIECFDKNGSIEKVDGIAYKDSSGIFQRTPVSSTNIKLNDLPIINRRLYNLEKYTHHSMMASRGCPYKCKFCCNYTGTILQHGVTINQYSRVIEEMEYLQNEFGATEIFFADDIFLVRKRDILSFCQEYKRLKLNVKWIGQMRVDTIDEEIAIEMANSGCKRLYFGVESGSDEILRKSNKKLDKKQILLGINAAKKAGIRVKTGWIYGLPGTLEQQRESIDFMLEMRPHEISIHQLIPFPGTPYYNNPSEHGILINDKKDFESFCYGGISGNIQFDYMSQHDLEVLLRDTAIALDNAGYVCSDKATEHSEYIYSTPLNNNSMSVFKKEI